MDQDHCRGSMGPVQISGQWTGSKMGERGGGGKFCPHPLWNATCALHSDP